MSGSLEVEVHPPWPYRLPRRSGADGTTRQRQGVLTRLLHVHESPVVVHVWRRGSGEVVLRAVAAGPVAGSRFPELPTRQFGSREADIPTPPTAEAAGKDELELAIARMRFALGVDDDYAGFFGEFKRDPVIGPALRARPWLRPRRRPWPWEALAWAITAQLIEATRAAEIQRRMVRRWGRALQPQPGTSWTGPGPLRDVPEVGLIAERAPAELAGTDLSAARATALIRCAAEVAAGRVDPDDSAGDARLRSIREIGPWTTQCLGLNGRGDADSLPAGDLAYVKLVGRLAGLGRRATIPEIDEFFAPYAPYRGLAGTFAITHYHLAVATGPPLRLAA